MMVRSDFDTSTISNGSRYFVRWNQIEIEPWNSQVDENCSIFFVIYTSYNWIGQIVSVSSEIETIIENS